MRRINPFFALYLVVIYFPLAAVVTVLCAVVTTVMSLLFGNYYWGFYPGKVWARVLCYYAFVRVRVHGMEHCDSHKSYVFVPNHQSAFDVFVIYGWLKNPFKWIMKQDIRRIPFVGLACAAAGHVFIDRSSPMRAQHSIQRAAQKLSNGTSVVIFPEGRRTRDGRLGPFKRGAFFTAAELDMPIVPVSIKGADSVLPYRAFYIKPGVIDLTIHIPRETTQLTHNNINTFIEETRQIVQQGINAVS